MWVVGCIGVCGKAVKQKVIQRVSVSNEKREGKQPLGLRQLTHMRRF